MLQPLPAALKSCMNGIAGTASLLENGWSLISTAVFFVILFNSFATSSLLREVLFNKPEVLVMGGSGEQFVHWSEDCYTKNFHRFVDTVVIVSIA